MTRALAAVLLATCMGQAAFAPEGQGGKTWTGKQDDRWENEANWEPPGAPDRDSTVLVPAGRAVLRRTAVVKRLVVDEKAELRIEGDRTLYVRDDLEVNGLLRFGAGKVEVDGRIEIGTAGRIVFDEDEKQSRAGRPEARTLTWTGAVSADWADASNWSPGVAPDSMTAVIVPAAKNPPVLSVRGSVGSLTIQNDGRLTFAGSAALDVSGDVVVNGTLDVGNGSVTIAGNWTNTGNFVPGTSTVVFNGSTGQTINGAAHFNIVTVGAGTTTGSIVHVNDTATVTAGALRFEPDTGTRVWRGKPDGDWFDPKNWEPAGIPGKDDLVVLKSDPLLSKDAEVRGLVVEPSGKLILEARLTVREDAAIRGPVVLRKGGDLNCAGLTTFSGEGRLTRE